MTRTLVKFAPGLALIALASCGADNQSSNGGTAVENATLTKLNLTSSAFPNGQRIPAQYTCDGPNPSPPLAWGNPPPGTKSFALVMDDPDAPGGTFRHWAVYDIPATVRSIAAGQTVGTQAINDFGKLGYGGPCPPKGGGPHRYIFKLHAVKVDRLSLPANARVGEVDREAEQQLVERAELTGIYERK